MVDKVSYRQKELARKLDPTQNSVNAVISSETRQTTKVALAYLKLILSYVNLKVSIDSMCLSVGLPELIIVLRSLWEWKERFSWV